MEVYPIIGNYYGSNCYIIKSGKIALIDAGVDINNTINIGIDFLIITHCHYDHVAKIHEIIKRFHPIIMAHRIDAKFLENADEDYILSDLFSADYSKINVDVKLNDGDVIDLDNIKLEVIHTPGHTDGSICLYERESGSLFTGDTVFADGIGRTDLPGGNPEKMKKSLQRLYKLYINHNIKTIYPGHGNIGVGRDIEKNYLMFL